MALLDLGAEEVQLDRTRFDNVLETFVLAELLKHTTTAEGDYRLLHYRDADQVEVDVVLENAAGQLVGVEVKAAATVKPSDLRGLKKLASLAGSQFKLGVLLYDGAETLPLGDGIWAVPMSTLWGGVGLTLGKIWSDNDGLLDAAAADLLALGARRDRSRRWRFCSH